MKFIHFFPEIATNPYDWRTHVRRLHLTMLSLLYVFSRRTKNQSHFFSFALNIHASTCIFNLDNVMTDGQITTVWRGTYYSAVQLRVVFRYPVSLVCVQIGTCTVIGVFFCVKCGCIDWLIDLWCLNFPAAFNAFVHCSTCRIFLD